MHWQQAIEISKEHIAFRSCGSFAYILRYADGRAVIHDQGRLRDAFGEEIEGYMDWQPYGGVIGTYRKCS